VGHPPPSLQHAGQAFVTVLQQGVKARPAGRVPSCSDPFGTWPKERLGRDEHAAPEEWTTGYVEVCAPPEEWTELTLTRHSVPLPLASAS